MITGIFKVIFYLFIIYMVYLLYRFFKALSRATKSQGSSRKKLSGLMVKDEYCNTYLPKEDAIRQNIDGKEYFFCSEECRQKFLHSSKK